MFIPKLQILKTHWAAMVFALLVAVAMVAPELIMRLSLGGEFKGVYMHGSDGELFYLARMNQTYQGISAWDSPFLYEYKGEFPLTYALFAEPVLAYPGKWLGIPVQELNLIYKFLFSAVISLLIYSLAFRLMKDVWWALATTVFIVAGYRLITVPGILNFINWRNAYAQFSLYARPVTTQISWVIFWSFLHLILSAVQKREWKYFIAGGVLFGLSFYVYLYTWTMLATLMGVVTLGALLFRQKGVAEKMAIAMGLGFLMGVPYILNILAVTQHEYFPVYKIITFLHEWRKPDISKIGLVVAMLSFWYSKKSKTRSTEDALLLALLVVTFVVTNQQILTKRVLEVGHYHLFFNISIYILVLFYLAKSFFSKIDRRYVNIGLTVVILASSLNAYLMQASSYSGQALAAKSEQRYAGVFNWLNTHATPGSVVLASNDAMALLLSTYTRSHVYWSSASQLYMMPPERIETALFLFLKLYGIRPEKLGGETFFHPEASLDQRELAEEHSWTTFMLYEPLRRSYRDGMLARYTEFFKQTPQANFQQYRLDYIIQDMAVDRNWDEAFIAKSFVPVETVDDVRIYGRKNSTK